MGALFQNCSDEDSSLAFDRTKKSTRTSFDEDDFELLGVVGIGCMGRVYRAFHRGSQQEVALKVIPKARIGAKQRELLYVEKEVLTRLRGCSTINQLIATFQTRTHLCFVLELEGNGDLKELMLRQPHKMLPCDAVAFYGAELLTALRSLRESNVVHRDIKPDNLLLSSDGHLRLADFNSARMIANPTTSEADDTLTSLCSDSSASFSPLGLHWTEALDPNAFVGTPAYLPPEAFLLGTDAHLGTAGDLWAFGVVLFELHAGYTPFDASEAGGFPYVVERICCEDVVFPLHFSATLRDLLSKILVKDPSARLGVDNLAEVFCHPFFAGIDFSTLASTSSPVSGLFGSFGEETFACEEELVVQPVVPLLPHQVVDDESFEASDCLSEMREEIKRSKLSRTEFHLPSEKIPRTFAMGGEFHFAAKGKSSLFFNTTRTATTKKERKSSAPSLLRRSGASLASLTGRPKRTIVPSSMATVDTTRMRPLVQ